MRGWIIAPTGLIEPVPAPEILFDGIGAIEVIGGGDLRFYLVQEQLPLEAVAIIPQNVVVAKLVAPASIVTFTIGQLAQCVMRDHAEHGPRTGPRLVK